MKCSNGMWKYGEHGNCQFDTLEACKRAEAAINAQNNPQTGGPHSAHPEVVQNKLPVDPVNPDNTGSTDYYTNNPDGHMTMEDMYNQANTYRW
jgi:hypothetical protein